MATATATQRRLDPKAVESELPSVLAIVVSHAGERWIRDCLVGLNTQTYPLVDVLVVDDASPRSPSQPRLARVAKRHLRRRRWGFLRTPRTLGFGGAINWALARVRTDADLLLFIHDDAALDPNAVERMVARVLVDDVTAIVGPKIVSWHDPSRLEEVGMAIDRFGYPYKGLEDGEIDLGQHDASREVFYVTSTCMLMRHDVFKNLRGWDARMRAFSEDLDLCWRARLAGHVVRVEPLATARHAIALATGQRPSRFRPTRYYIRRNRLRAVAKNVSGVRLIPLLVLFMALWLAEMVGFVVLRQPREILNLARALVWNLGTSPQMVAERAHVQRRRRIADRRLRGLHVREVTRLLFYLSNKTERLEHAWGRRAEIWAGHTAQVRALGRQLSGVRGLVAFLVAIGLALGLRHLLFSPPVTVGELLPFPRGATGLWRAFASSWHAVGFGYSGPAPPAFVPLGLVQLVAFGAPGAAQKLLLVALGGIAFAGGYKLVADLVDRPARAVAGASYALGAVGYAGLREGRLGALAFGAAAPFVVLAILRLTGWSRPPGWNRGRGVARLAVGTAASAAFVPGAVLLYAGVAAVLSGGRWVLERKARGARGLYSSLIGIAVGWALLLPWSAGWLAPGGALEIVGGAGGDVFRDAWRGHGMLTVVAGQTPQVPALVGLALPLLGLVAALVGDGQRRRMALAFWALVVTIGWLTTVTAAGVVPLVVPSPTEAGVVAAVAFAGLTGLAVGAFRLDLPRRDLGVAHALAAAGLGLAAILIAAGVLPALWRGEWGPARGTSFAPPAVVDQVLSVLSVADDDAGPFRSLWVGEQWGGGAYGAAHAPRGLLVTGSHGQTLRDLFGRHHGAAQRDFESAVASIVDGATDRGGNLLGAFSIRFVVLGSGTDANPWLAQRDLAVIRTEPEYLLLEVQSPLARAGVYDDLPAHVRALDSGDASVTAAVGPSSGPSSGDSDPEPAAIRRVADHHLVVAPVSGPGTAFLAESADAGWEAAMDGATLGRVRGGWGNAFAVSAGSSGELVLRYPRGGRVVWILLMVLAWAAVLGAALGRGHSPLQSRAAPR